MGIGETLAHQRRFNIICMFLATMGKQVWSFSSLRISLKKMGNKVFLSSCKPQWFSSCVNIFPCYNVWLAKIKTAASVFMRESKCMHVMHPLHYGQACALKIVYEQRATDFRPGLFWSVAQLFSGSVK